MNSGLKPSINVINWKYHCLCFVSFVNNNCLVTNIPHAFQCFIGRQKKIACSRLLVVGDERKRARKKWGRTKARLPHFFFRSPFFAPNYWEPGTGLEQANKKSKMNFAGLNTAARCTTMYMFVLKSPVIKWEFTNRLHMQVK